jgi:hypothetical protein
MNGHEHDPCGGLLWRICVAAAIPSRPGIETSLTITSGDSCSAASTSAKPSCTSPTTSNSGWSSPDRSAAVSAVRGSSASRPSDCSSLPDRTRPPDRSSVRDRRGRAEVRRQTQLGLPRSWKPRAARGTGIGADLLGKPPGASGISEVLRVTWRLLSAFCHSIQAVSASFGTSIFIHGLEPNRPVALGPLSIPVPSRTRGGPQFGKAQWGPALCGATVGGARGDSSRVSDTDKGSTLRLARAGPGLGLVSMDERLKLVDGDLQVDTQPQRGTRIHARAPFSVRRRFRLTGSRRGAVSSQCSS